MALQTTVVDGVQIVHLPSELIDQLTIREWGAALLEFVERDDTKDIVIDFAATNRFSSEAIGYLLRASRRVREQESEIKLAAMSEEIRQVFKIMSLDGTVFDIVAVIRDAVNALKS